MSRQVCRSMQPVVGPGAVGVRPCSRPLATARRCYTIVPTDKDSEGEGQTLHNIAAKQNLTTEAEQQLGGPGMGTKDADMAAMFTCGVCETRVMKMFTRHSYENGVVIVQCPGCKNNHVLADNLGWFGEEKNVEEILQAKGEKVFRAKMENGDIVIA